MCLDCVRAWVIVCVRVCVAKFLHELFPMCKRVERKRVIIAFWMDKSCKGEQNRMNVKHILANAEVITVGTVVMTRINSQKCTGMVLDLLECYAPQKASKRRSQWRKRRNRRSQQWKGKNRRYTSTLDCIILESFTSAFTLNVKWSCDLRYDINVHRERQ